MEGKFWEFCVKDTLNDTQSVRPPSEGAAKKTSVRYFVTTKGWAKCPFSPPRFEKTAYAKKSIDPICQRYLRAPLKCSTQLAPVMSPVAATVKGQFSSILLEFLLKNEHR